MLGNQLKTVRNLLYVYYGDSSTDFQTDSNGPNYYSGTNMMGLTDIRAEFQGFSNPKYDSQLTGLTATYQIGISPNSDGSDPVGLVSFGLK